jgi:RNA polymerase sigma-70 factor (ECF subfamily)
VPKPSASGTPPEGAPSPPRSGRADTATLDAALLDELRAGHSMVADAFCRSVWPQVDRTVRRLTGGDHNEADDFSQLAVIELVRTIGSYRGECALDTWIAAVTAHVVYKQLRRAHRGRHLSLDLVQEHRLPSSCPNAERDLAVRQVLDRILAHLDAVGDKLAESFVLHDVFGYSLREVAHLTGASEAAVQSRLSRGRRRLHERIAGDPELAELLDEGGAPRPTSP